MIPLDELLEQLKATFTDFERQWNDAGISHSEVPAMGGNMNMPMVSLM